MSVAYDYHRAILHIDGDAFFASCEQATNRSLRGKAIAVGKERGAATAYSYEAKRMGVTRGMSMKELQSQFPTIQVVSSDYKKYALFSNRMKTIALRYTQQVEKTSIDECYVDITGLDEVYKMSYHELVEKIQEELCTALGMTFSIGIGPTKKLAKIGSGCNKPHGITTINSKNLKDVIYKLDISRVPGIGYRTVPKMHAYGIYTIGDFVGKDKEWVAHHFSKPYQETHSELQGYVVDELQLMAAPPKSISKIHAFEKPTNDEVFLLGELSRHCEVLAKKLRRHNLGATKIHCSLKTFNKQTTSQEYVFDSPVHDPQILFTGVKEIFELLKEPGVNYRATSVVMSGLKSQSKQQGLFEKEVVDKKCETKEVLSVIDEIHNKYGVSSITHASSNKNTRDFVQENSGLIYSKLGNKILYLPYLGICD